MIRKADISDIPAIKAMADVVFRLTYGSILSESQLEYMMDWMYSPESLERQMTEGGHTFFVSDGQGYVSYRYDKALPDGTQVFHLEKLYVMPQCQGSGLGRQLFDTIVSEVKRVSDGPAVIELNVNRYNPAVSFYEHLGMHKDRSGDFPIGEGYYMNDYIMAISVDPTK